MARFTTRGPKGDQGEPGNGSPTDTYDKIYTTSNGSGTNVKIGDDAWIGDVNTANHLSVNGAQDATKGGIILGSGKTEKIVSNATDMTLSANNDIILNPGSTYGYIGTPLQNGNNRIATIANVPRYYGSFYHTETVLLNSATTAFSIPLNSTAETSGVSVVSNSRITVANAGLYNIQFSLQLDKTDEGNDIVNVWFAKNNSNIAWSNTQFTVSSADRKHVAALNYFVTLAANDYIELKAQSPDTNMRIVASGTQSNPARPAVPSSIVTINQIA